MNYKTIIAASVAGLMGTSAMAQDSGDVTVGVGLSTFGANIEAAFQVAPQIRARGAFMGGFSQDFEIEEDDVTGDGSFDVGGIALLADYYPLQNGLRVSGGLFLSNNEFSADGTAAGEDATIGLEFANQISPMITVGYDLGFGNGWAFTSEAGAVFTGGLDLSATADNDVSQGIIDNDQDVQDAIADAEEITVVPYIALGISYSY